MPADLPHSFEQSGQGRAGFERAIRRALNHGPIGDRIGEGNSQLDQIRPAALERENQRRRMRGRGSPAVR